MFRWKTAIGSAEEFKQVVPTGAGYVRFGSFFNVHATTTFYVWFFDGPAAAVTNPIWGPVKLGPGLGEGRTFEGPGSGPFDEAELDFANGLYVAASLTNGTFTAAGVNCLRMYVKGVR